MNSARRPSIARSRGMLGATSVLSAVLSLTTLMLTPAVVTAATPRTFYVSCSGSDSATGRSTGSPWRTLAKASGAALKPGDRLRLKRGCSFRGPLRTGTSSAPWAGTASQPITIDDYGTGTRPRVRDAGTNFDVIGSYLVFADLWTSTPPTSYDSQCQNAPRGNTYGWRLMPGSHHITIKRSRAVGLHFGVWVNDGSHHARILSNEFIDINVKDPNPSSDAGAVAVAIHGDDNEIAWNHIEGSDSCSRFYGRDGSAVEIYGGRRNVIHHNTAVDNNAFMELGHKPGTSRLAQDTTIGYNEVRSRLNAANFLVVRGAGDQYGPNLRTNVRHNSVYLTGNQSYALQCLGGCTPEILVFKDNVVWAKDRVGFIDGTWTEARNVWWSPTRPGLWFDIAGSSFHRDPRYRDAANGDLRLRSSSPAVDAGGSPPSLPGGPRDLRKVAVPHGAAPDIGAHERR